MSTIEAKLGRTIARQRKAVGLTQAQLAEKIGVQPETISRIETGSRTPSLDLVVQLSDALSLELHDLFRLHDRDDPKDEVVERLLWLASRLTVAEVELLMDVGDYYADLDSATTVAVQAVGFENGIPYTDCAITLPAAGAVTAKR